MRRNSVNFSQEILGLFDPSNYGLIEGGNAVIFFFCFFGRLTLVILCLLVDHRLKNSLNFSLKLFGWFKPCYSGSKKGGNAAHFFRKIF